MRRRAQVLRSNATPQENKLWYQYLRKYPVQWNRQKPLDGYIVDFYCHRARLVLELDGSQHFTSDGLAYDAVRTDHLEAMGLKVLRFTNTDIDHRFRQVCNAIDHAVRCALPGGSPDLPPGEGGTAQP